MITRHSFLATRFATSGAKQVSSSRIISIVSADSRIAVRFFFASDAKST
jgi:hypothetical protein